MRKIVWLTICVKLKFQFCLLNGLLVVLTVLNGITCWKYACAAAPPLLTPARPFSLFVRGNILRESVQQQNGRPFSKVSSLSLSA